MLTIKITKINNLKIVTAIHFKINGEDYFLHYSNEEYENDNKPTTIKEFKDWITNKDCDWFYEVDRWEEYEWGLRIFLKF